MKLPSHHTLQLQEMFKGTDAYWHIIISTPWYLLRQVPVFNIPPWRKNTRIFTPKVAITNYVSWYKPSQLWSSLLWCLQILTEEISNCFIFQHPIITKLTDLLICNLKGTSYSWNVAKLSCLLSVIKKIQKTWESPYFFCFLPKITISYPFSRKH